MQLDGCPPPAELRQQQITLELIFGKNEALKGRRRCQVAVKLRQWEQQEQITGRIPASHSGVPVVIITIIITLR
jgi:hypothetical protein